MEELDNLHAIRNSELRTLERVEAINKEMLTALKVAEAQLVTIYNAMSPSSEGRFADKDHAVIQIRAAISRATQPQDDEG